MKLEHTPGIFYTKTPDGRAEVHYRTKDNVMHIYDTRGPKQDRTKFYVDGLLMAAFDFARGNEYGVELECPEAQTFVERHKQYKKDRGAYQREQSTHTITVEKYAGSLDDLARDVTQLRYDAVAEFLGYLAKEIASDAKTDRNRGRRNLATKLEQSAHALDEAKEEMDAAWEICKPYMKKE